MRQRLTGLAASLLLLVLLAGLPALLITLGLPDLPSTVPAPGDLLGALTTRDDGTLALNLIGTVAWVTWAVISGCLVVELTAALRGRPARTLPGLALPQAASRHLIAAAALLFVVPPTLTSPTDYAYHPASATSTRTAATTSTTTSTTTSATTAPGSSAVSTETTRTHDEGRVDAAPGTMVHTVRVGESLWSIAEDLLGSGERYAEIQRLNLALLDGNPDHIEPGWVLHLPDQPSTARAAAGSERVRDQGARRLHVVRPGETLSGIAQDAYGDAAAYPRIFRASRDHTQPDGTQLTDPDLIRPGWTLRVPPIPTPREVPTPLQPSTAPTPNPDRGQPDAEGGETQRGADPKPGSRASDPEGVQDVAQDNAQDAAQDARDDAAQIRAPWVLLGLTTGGGLLAASLYCLLRARRRDQFRSRRPGRTLPDTPTRLAPVERTILSVGALTEPALWHIHTTLQKLALQQRSRDFPMPRLAATELTASGLVLHLTRPADLPAPWEDVADRLHWRLPNAAAAEDGPPEHPGVDPELDDPVDAACPAPYPLLVTVGTGDNGSTWLFNLEEFGVLRVTGDVDYACDFARHAVTELTTAPWARDVYVDCLGDFDDLATLRPARVRTYPSTGSGPSAEHGDPSDSEDAGDAADVGDAVGRAIADAVAQIDRQTTPDPPDLPTVRTAHDTDLVTARLLVAHRAVPLEDEAADARPGSRATGPSRLTQLVELISGHPVRTGTAALLIGDHPVEGFELQFTSTGRVIARAAGLDLIPTGLTGDEARGCAAILATSDLDDSTGYHDHHDDADRGVDEGDLGGVEVPVDHLAASGWRASADLAGSPRVEVTLPRQRITGATGIRDVRDVRDMHDGRDVGDDGDEVGTLLPGPDEEYTAHAATTSQDLQALAPTVLTTVADAISEADPTLDADLSAWFSDSCPLPRLRLLGPVAVEAHGTLERRKPYYAEVVAYLALHPHGVTTEQIMDAFAISGDRVRKVMSVVRDWLGPNPHTGANHLPDATQSRAARTRGTRTYQLDGVLVDADLFRRLRLRGTTRGGPEGIADLRRALSLVTGRPFDQLRPQGWTWLWEGDRHDHHLVVAILDVAHTLTVHALHQDDTASARAANEVALQVSPDDEAVLLDMASITAAEGHDAEAARILNQDLCNEWRNGEPPLELSPRSEEILRRWAQHSQAAS